MKSLILMAVVSTGLLATTQTASAQFRARGGYVYPSNNYSYPSYYNSTPTYYNSTPTYYNSTPTYDYGSSQVVTSGYTPAAIISNYLPSAVSNYLPSTPTYQTYPNGTYYSGPTYYSYPIYNSGSYNRGRRWR
jgi:hypothetical protein